MSPPSSLSDLTAVVTLQSHRHRHSPISPPSSPSVVTVVATRMVYVVLQSHTLSPSSQIASPVLIFTSQMQIVATPRLYERMHHTVRLKNGGEGSVQWWLGAIHFKSSVSTQSVLPHSSFISILGFLWFTVFPIVKGMKFYQYWSIYFELLNAANDFDIDNNHI
ncbi:hypothetical protein A2U01_0014607, partial [Trifolium medium]|nr:hypothetical protein [Trifolium medium]